MLTASEPRLCIPLVCPNPLSGIGGDVAKAAARAVLESMSAALNRASDWLVGHVVDLVNSTTSPRFDVRWFGVETAHMGAVVAAVMLPVLMAASIGPVLRQDGRRLLRVWAVGLPVAVLAGAASAQAASLALSATDAMCAVLLGGGSVRVAHQVTDAMSSQAVSTSPVFVQIILSTVALAGSVLVWLELMVRSAAVYVATFFMPLALVTFIWPSSAAMARRAVEILVSLVLSKFVIVAALVLGLAAFSGSGPDAAMAGGAILLLAGFAPFALMRLAPVVEMAAIGHLEGLSRRPAQAATRAFGALAGVGSHPITQLLMSQGDSGGSARGRPEPTSIVAQAIPERPPDYPLDGSGDGERGG